MPTLEAKRILGLGGSSLLLGDQKLRFVITAERRLALVAEDEALTILFSEPAPYAGLYAVLPAVVAAGPLALTLPAIDGTPAVGNTLSLRTALWVYDGTRPDPLRSLQWRRDGIAIAGETGLDYTVTAADAGADLDVVETLAAETGEKTYTTPAVAILA